jgi:hypothetical protein
LTLGLPDVNRSDWSCRTIRGGPSFGCIVDLEGASEVDPKDLDADTRPATRGRIGNRRISAENFSPRETPPASAAALRQFLFVFDWDFFSASRKNLRKSRFQKLPPPKIARP